MKTTMGVFSTVYNNWPGFRLHSQEL